MIFIIRDRRRRVFDHRATLEQMDKMLEAYGVFIKIAVDIEREILAGGAERHYECEQELLKDGSRQKDLWGADWYPYTKEISFESLINIRPSQNNRTMIVKSPMIQEKITIVAERLLGEYNA